jgi:hypothetical protein
MSGVKSRLVIGKRSAWWNRQLTGKWLWGTWIGFGISVLIASQIVRWLAITLAVLGCLFAIAFRLIRKDGEMNQDSK